MEYTTLGRTGIDVSQICLGTMSFGSGREWGLDQNEAQEIVDRAIDLGVNFFDTANIYSTGESEEILGHALQGYDRDRLVISTKVHRQIDQGNPNSQGLSRKTIQQELEHSLDRLGLESVDLYHLHTSDPNTEVEQTLRTLDSLVDEGSIRNIGVSSLWAHEFAEMLSTTERLNLEPISVMQDHYNLVYREEERDVLPLCEKHDVGVIPYSPLARGYLTRPHQDVRETERGDIEGRERDFAFSLGGGREINERVEELAEEYGVSMAQISIAWLLHKEVVSAPIIGVSSVAHLEDAVEATEMSLSESDLLPC
jgi:aryl-alcohol dehydrogenase-like predicted oxidoreductase